MIMTQDVIGNKFWKNEQGEYHREDGPAIEHADGYKAWWRNGERHRVDGPAIEYKEIEEYWLYGTEYKKEVWEEIVKSLKFEKVRDKITAIELDLGNLEKRIKENRTAELQQIAEIHSSMEQLKSFLKEEDIYLRRGSGALQ
jgi:hypothetical protein